MEKQHYSLLFNKAAQTLIRHRMVTLMVLVRPLLRPVSRRDKGPDFLSQQRIVAFSMTTNLDITISP
ncbi:hypothetical protein [Symbiopectobacterium purcellii]|uniref:Uncharacterized protein n=1 Tax=Symbiopectobacterium purcellii TaxID=2871826 RepID=A0ABX9ATP8_9ENTR|nr:hypothetical protein [Symbiopectobacterium purcellii]QZN96350.1 hypothetical protein K6K13_02435 [Symbiopectobacterium purcellii]QZN96429.1 hypothetical protein K6K13_02890 [Symbiopectobacterium purcellii]